MTNKCVQMTYCIISQEERKKKSRISLTLIFTFIYMKDNVNHKTN